jgi:hypothetical protein
VNNVQFAIQTKEQFENYRHLDIDSPAPKIGIVKGNNNILHWRGPLTHGSEYFLRIDNKGSNIISYCLVPSDVENWAKCP